MFFLYGIHSVFKGFFSCSYMNEPLLNSYLQCNFDNILCSIYPSEWKRIDKKRERERDVGMFIGRSIFEEERSYPFTLNWGEPILSLSFSLSQKGTTCLRDPSWSNAKIFSRPEQRHDGGAPLKSAVENEDIVKLCGYVFVLRDAMRKTDFCLRNKEKYMEIHVVVFVSSARLFCVENIRLDST